MADVSSNPPRESATDQDLWGRSLDDFHLLRRLARGAMAEVYLAEQSFAATAGGGQGAQERLGQG